MLQIHVEGQKYDTWHLDEGLNPTRISDFTGAKLFNVLQICGATIRNTAGFNWLGDLVRSYI